MASAVNYAVVSNNVSVGSSVSTARAAADVALSGPPAAADRMSQ